MEAMKAEKEYEKTFKELKKELTSMELEQEIIRFYLKYAQLCGGKGARLAQEDESYYIETIVKNHDEGIYRLEKFISANEEG